MTGTDASDQPTGPVPSVAAAPPARPTLRQVAALSGVSLKTASRALNGHPHVTEQTATRVKDAAHQLGFRLNGIARELRSGATSTTVGLVIGDVANPFYSRIAAGAERALRARGLQLITASSDDDPDLEREITSSLLERRVRALLMVPCSGDHSYLEEERRHGTPIVCLDRPPQNLVADSILLDNRVGTRTAVEHLLSYGHRRIGLVGDLDRLPTHRERLAGFAEALLAAGIADWERWVRSGCHDVESAERAADDLLSETVAPTALFASNNRNTIGTLRALARHSERVALVGFDDFDLADVLGVTVMAHDPSEMGRLAVEVAWARLEGETGPANHIVLPTTLIPRGSGEIPPADVHEEEAT